MEAISESLYYEVSHFGVRVVIVEPGYVGEGMRHYQRHGEEAPYDELRRQYSAVDDALNPDGRPSYPWAGEQVADAVERALAGKQNLRQPVGADAELILAARRSLDDESFEAIMRDTLKLTW